MEFNSFNNIAPNHEQELALQKAMPTLMQKVFVWMAMALAITGITAYTVTQSPAMLQLMFGSRIPIFLCIAAEFGIVIYLSSRISRMSLTTATVWFIVYSILTGITLAPIFLVYTGASIAKTFLITGGTFGAMALIGFTTKRDLSKMGSLLFMALIGLIISTLVNLFLKSTMFEMILSGLGVLIFTGLTAWDVQSIKKMLLESGEVSESTMKLALLGALTLYLDFINLFLYLLRFFGDRK